MKNQAVKHNAAPTVQLVRPCAAARLFPASTQVARDIDAHNVRSELRRWQCRGAIAASEIEDLEFFRDSESLHERLAAFAHGLGKAREVAFFPECFVWIHEKDLQWRKQIGQPVNFFIGGRAGRTSHMRDPAPRILLVLVILTDT
jgi:hypothetical protein